MRSLKRKVHGTGTRWWRAAARIFIYSKLGPIQSTNFCLGEKPKGLNCVSLKTIVELLVEKMCLVQKHWKQANKPIRNTMLKAPLETLPKPSREPTDAWEARSYFARNCSVSHPQRALEIELGVAAWQVDACATVETNYASTRGSTAASLRTSTTYLIKQQRKPPSICFLCKFATNSNNRLLSLVTMEHLKHKCVPFESTQHLRCNIL